MNLFERAMNVLGCRDVDEVVFDAPFIITEHMIQFLHIDVVVEPSMKIGQRGQPAAAASSVQNAAWDSIVLSLTCRASC